jgi:hypothetical protein
LQGLEKVTTLGFRQVLTCAGKHRF